MTAGGEKGGGGKKRESSVGELRRLFSREEWGVAFVIRISLCVRGLPVCKNTAVGADSRM